MATHQSVLTPTWTFSSSSEVAAHKLKPRLFHKSTHLQVYSADFHSGVNCTWQAARIMNDLVNLSTVPIKYHKFADIFGKARAETLALHHLYNL